MIGDIWSLMKDMKHESLTVLAVIALLTATPVAIAQDAPAETPRQASETPETPPESEAEDDDVFIPSEELSADEEVTFPVDI